MNLVNVALKVVLVLWDVFLLIKTSRRRHSKGSHLPVNSPNSHNGQGWAADQP